MLPTSNTMEPLTNYDVTGNSQSHLRERTHTHLDPISYPDLSRTSSQCSAQSCSSVSALVSHPKITPLKQSHGPGFFSWNLHKEKIHDSEKSQDEKNEEAEGDEPNPATYKAWHGWQLVFFGSCSFSVFVNRFN